MVLIGALVALAGSQGGATVAGLPVFAMAVAAAFVIQWVVFVPSFAAQTERFFDLTGSLTYISITLAIVLLTPGVDARALLLAALVLVWAARLGTFLVRRVHRAGKDDRFDELKPSLVRFLNVWTLQGLWVTLTAAAAWVSITSATRVGLDVVRPGRVRGLGRGLRDRDRGGPAEEPLQRRPRQQGQIHLHRAVGTVAAPQLLRRDRALDRGRDHRVAHVSRAGSGSRSISPLFVALLLTKVSGVPLLERKADAKWGGQADYEAYKASTPVLVPKLR